MKPQVTTSDWVGDEPTRCFEKCQKKSHKNVATIALFLFFKTFSRSKKKKTLIFFGKISAKLFLVFHINEALLLVGYKSDFYCVTAPLKLYYIPYLIIVLSFSLDSTRFC